MVVAAHLVAVVMRRSGRGMVPSTAVSLVAMVLLGSAIFYGDTVRLFLPTGETLDALRADARTAATIYADESAPVVAARGLVVGAAAILWWLAFLADWAAFRLRSTLEALAPATAVFVFTALLGVEQNQIAHGATFAAAAAAVVLALRADRRVLDEAWMGRGSASGVATTFRVGLVSGALAVLAAVAVGPSLPGAGDDPIIDVTELDTGPDTRTVISPLVEISASLFDQPEAEVFSVAVAPDERDYWRLMALTEFDGRTWGRSSNFDEIRGPLPSDIDESVNRRTVRQTFTVASLGGIYLPAAYEPSVLVDDGGAELEYEADTGALVVTRDDEDRVVDGFRYTVESQVPDFDPDALPSSATEGLPAEFVREHTQLPEPCAAESDGSCWPSAVTDLALAITAGAESDLQRAQLLQNHFLDPTQYSYDLSVARNHDVRTLEDFLFVVRQGYCEQFAAAFASMARSIGLPTRVAVGFTWGEWDEGRAAYVVSGKHAHAWPEVFFADVGWVAFDPTPGRNRPYDNDVTGVPGAAQLGEGDEVNRADPATSPESTAPPTTTPAPTDESPTDEPDTPTPTTPDDPGGSVATEAGPATDDNRWGPVMRIGAIVAALVTLAALVPLTRHLVRRRSEAQVAADPVGRTELAWDHALDALRLVGLSRRPAETPLEFAHRVQRGYHLDVGPVRELAEAVTRLRYGDEANAATVATTAIEAGATVERTCRDIVGRRRAVADRFDPRFIRPTT